MIRRVNILPHLLCIIYIKFLAQGGPEHLVVVILISVILVKIVDFDIRYIRVNS